MAEASLKTTREKLDTLVNGNISDFFEWVDQLSPRAALLVGYRMRRDKRFKDSVGLLKKKASR